MKVNEMILHRGASLALAAIATVAISTASYAHDSNIPDRARTNFSTAVPVTEVNTGAAEGCPIESADGLSLFVASTRPSDPTTGDVALGGNDIWVADRDSLTSPWKKPRNIGAPVNSSAADFCPTPVYGRWLFFVSDRGAAADGSGPVPCGNGDIYLSRQSPADGWSTPQMLKCAADGGPNFPGAERSPSLLETWYGTFLFYSSTGNGTTHDIYMSRMDAKGNFGPGQKVENVNTEFDDIMPNVREREDGSIEMVFASNRPTWGKGQAAFGQQDIYITTSYWATGGWTTPQNLGPAVNTAGVEQRSTLSADGKRLYFGRDGDIYMSTR